MEDNSHHGKGFWKVAIVWVFGLSSDDVKGSVRDAGIGSVLRGKVKDTVGVLADTNSLLFVVVVLEGISNEFIRGVRLNWGEFRVRGIIGGVLENH